MTQKEFLASLTDTYADCVAISEKKNTDYAGISSEDENPFKNFELFEYLFTGLDISQANKTELTIFTRILDKISRLATLLIQEGEVDESIEDTIKDGINYLAILKAYREKK